MIKAKKYWFSFFTILILTALFSPQFAEAQTYASEESAREDKFTGGIIERTTLEPGNKDIRVTVDVPAFLLTLWQGDKEVTSFHIGVGQKDFPIAIGPRAANQIVLNPDWIPPDSDWVREAKFKPGKAISAANPKNPLGKIKIPLGDGYLLHQAKGAGDLGSLVSHGCVRVMLGDLFNLSKKIAVAYDLPTANIEISRADKKQRFLNLDAPLAVDIFYDTMVVERGILHVYPDVYDYKKNTLENLRAQLNGYGIEPEEISDATLKKILARVKGKQQFAVSLEDLRNNRALTKGKFLPVVSAKK